jgi:hypothetical protein
MKPKYIIIAFTKNNNKNDSIEKSLPSITTLLEKSIKYVSGFNKTMYFAVPLPKKERS